MISTVQPFKLQPPTKFARMGKHIQAKNFIDLFHPPPSDKGREVTESKFFDIPYFHRRRTVDGVAAKYGRIAYIIRTRP